MEQQKQEGLPSSEETNGQKVWETPTLETNQAAEGIQGLNLATGSDAFTLVLVS